MKMAAGVRRHDDQFASTRFKSPSNFRRWTLNGSFPFRRPHA